MRRVVALARRRPRRAAGVGAVVVIVVIVGWALAAALIARSRLNSARADLLDLRNHPPTNVAALLGRLDADRARARSAAGVLGQPGPWILGHLPIIGRSLTAERTIADAAGDLLGSARGIAKDADSLGSGGRVNLGKLDALERDLAAVPVRDATAVRRLGELQLGWTPPFVHRQARTAITQVSSVVRSFGTAAGAAQALGGILGADGPRTVIVALENNAEQRGTGGLLSSLAVGHSNDGSLQLGPFRSIQKVAQNDPAVAQRVPAPADYVHAYGRFLANTTIWRNVNMSPNVPESAQVIVQLAQASMHIRPNVIIFVDVPAMAAIVDSTGQPVHLPDGTTVTGDQLVRALLLQSYGAATTNPQIEAGRKAALQKAAGDVFRSVAGKPPTLALLKAVGAAAGGRHIALWSDRAAEERALLSAGVGGGTDPGGDDIAMVTTQNLGDRPGNGNKLDYYADRRLSVHVVVGRRQARVDETVTIANHTPQGLGPYIVGLKHPGQLLELLSVALPRSATVTRFRSVGGAVAAEDLVADGTRQLRTPFVLERGQSQTWQLSYTEPVRSARYWISAIPQPLAVPASLTLQVKAADGVSLAGLGSTVVPGSSVTHTGPWDGVIRIGVRVRGQSFWVRLKHDLSSFWNHKVKV